MPELIVELAQRSYTIRIESGLLKQTLAHPAIADKRLLLVTDANVGPLYANRLQSAIGAQCAVWQMPAGEPEKNLARFTELSNALAENGLSRDSCILALGGGVVGDLAGFAAACYMRGISFIQIPTSLLAMVDSSVGGKTAVDLPHGKNLVGAFHQPRAVWIDPEVLNTLPAREFNAGMAEVIKYGAIFDAEFFNWLNKHQDTIESKQASCLETLIARCCQLKAEVVIRDETEQAERALLNFGHTFAHAIEVLLDYSALLHGEAVAIGMLLAAEYSARLDFSTNEDSARLKQLLQNFNLPTQLPKNLSAEQIVAKMTLDKKSLNGKIRLILWRGIGQAFIHCEVDVADLQQFLFEKINAIPA